MAHVAPHPSPTHSHVCGSTNSSYICARCETASKCTTSLEPHMRECVGDGRPPTCSLEQTGGSHSCSIELASVTRQASTSAGAVRAERRVRSALTLEAGKSPTEVRWRRLLPTVPPSSISEYASPSSCSWSLNYALLEMGADVLVQYQGARARRAPQSTYRPHRPPGQYVD